LSAAQTKEAATSCWAHAKKAEGKMTEKISVRRDSKKYIYIHNDLSNAAWYFKNIIAQKLGTETRDGIVFDCMACLIMLAFTFEAHVNFLGDRLIDGWKEREAFDEKLKKVLDHLKVTPDERTRPYSSISLLKNFRNTLAHGKPFKEKFEETVIGRPKELDRPVDLSAAWEKDCNENVAFQACDDVEAVWKELLGKSGLPIVETITHGEGGITLIEPVDEA
jgi:hypothetical protein